MKIDLFKYERDLWYDLIGFYPQDKKKIHSPFRPDKTPKAFFMNKKGKIRFCDFADAQRHYKDAVQMFMIERKMTYAEVVDYCLSKFESILYKELESVRKKKINFVKKEDESDFILSAAYNRDRFIQHIIPVFIPFTKEARDYWVDIDIDFLAEKNRMKQVSGYYVWNKDKNLYYFVNKSNETAFAYIYKNKWGKEEYKIYTPKLKNKNQLKFDSGVEVCNFWFHKNLNFTDDDLRVLRHFKKSTNDLTYYVRYLSNVAKSVIVIKSSKDFIYMKHLLEKCGLNKEFDLFHLQSENVDERIVSPIISKYDNVYSFFDDDNAGNVAAAKLNLITEAMGKKAFDIKIEKEQIFLVPDQFLKNIKRKEVRRTKDLYDLYLVYKSFNKLDELYEKVKSWLK